METRLLNPSPQYLTRLRIVLSITLLSVLAFGALIVLPMAVSSDGGAVAVTAGLIILGLNAVWYVPGLFLAGAYYHSLRYEIQDDEVIVYAGIWTKSIKHVPYRTVTNLTIKRDIVDRWLGLGTLNIQTAGMSGTNVPEQSLVGLADVQAAYGAVAARLRRYRGALGPTQAEAEPEQVPLTGDALNALLAEVRAIRQTLEKGS